MSLEKISIPDIGAESAEVVEVLVSVGEQIEAEQSLFVLESEKASVEIPSPQAGIVTSISVSVGDKVAEGDVAIELDVEEVQTAEADASSGIDVAPQLDPLMSGSPASSAQPTEEMGMPFVDAVSITTLFLVPDIGADEAEIIELTVKVGDVLQEGDSIAVAESEKASLEIPAEQSGVVEVIHVSEGSKVKQGDKLISLLHDTAASTAKQDTSSAKSQNIDPPVVAVEEDVPILTEPVPQTYQVPDMGGDGAEVIEIFIAAGEQVNEGDSVCAVETDKASVEIPAPASGSVEALFVELGQKLSEGDDLMRILGAASAQTSKAAEPPKDSGRDASVKETAVSKAQDQKPKAVTEPKAAPAQAVSRSSSEVYAGPAARKHARQLGVDLLHVKGSGQRGRVQIDDINQYVKQRLQGSSSRAQGGAGLPEIPAVDWTKFGEVDVQPMSRIQKATAANMVRNWLNVPHVTQFDQADVTELETYRAYLKSEAVARGVKMTPVAFVLKAAATALVNNPKMNSSLHHNGEDLVFRKFVHIGLAVDTPIGLMVPVIRDVDKKDIWEIAEDIIKLAGKAKEGKLSPSEMQGGSFTVSSLGAIGGTGFTPIVSAPQVAILGVSNTSIQPVWDGTTFVPKKMMPLSLSYDHRAVNGADAGTFLTELVAVMQDLNRIWNG